MTGIHRVGNAMHLVGAQNTTMTSTRAGANISPTKMAHANADTRVQLKINISDISANTLARVGNELHANGQIDAETHLMMTIPGLGSAAMAVGGLSADALVFGRHIQDPEENIDMLQYASDNLDYMKMLNEKYRQGINTKPWERFISTLKELDGKEIFLGIDVAA
ncbi:MAG: hypothetical protein ABII81_02250 [Pseudomonadota bacterium]